MENKENQEQPKRREDDIQAKITDKDEKDPNLVDSFKSGDEKKDRTFSKPFDEQMYGSFAELKEQKGEGEEGEKED